MQKSKLILIICKLVITILIGGVNASVLAKAEPYRQLQTLLGQLDSAISKIIDQYNSEVKKIKKLEKVGQTKKANRLSEKLGEWESFLNKKLPKIDKKYIRRAIGRKYFFYSPAYQIDAYKIDGFIFKRVNFYDTSTKLIYFYDPSTEISDYDAEILDSRTTTISVSEKIKDLSKSIYKISKQLSPKKTLKDEKMKKKCRRYLLKIKRDAEKLDYHNYDLNKLQACSLVISAPILEKMFGKTKRELRQEKKNLINERNCWRSFQRQLYPPSDNSEKVDSIIEKMQEYDPETSEKGHLGNIIYQVQYKLIRDYNFSKNQRCIKKSYEVNWDTNSIHLYATEKFKPSGAIIKDERLTLKQLYNKKYMKNLMISIEEKIKLRKQLELKQQELESKRQERLMVEEELKIKNDEILTENERTKQLYEQQINLSNEIQEKRKMIQNADKNIKELRIQIEKEQN